LALMDRRRQAAILARHTGIVFSLMFMLDVSLNPVESLRLSAEFAVDLRFGHSFVARVALSALE
jgi:hypothetical protein